MPFPKGAGPAGRWFTVGKFPTPCFPTPFGGTVSRVGPYWEKWEVTDRELDALVATEVMGQSIPGGYEKSGDEWVTHDYARSFSVLVWPPHYSTSIADAWEVLRRVNELGWNIGICVEPDGDVWVTGWAGDSNCPHHKEFDLSDGHGYSSFDDICVEDDYEGEQAPRAICLAALAAVGVEVSDG